MTSGAHPGRLRYAGLVVGALALLTVVAVVAHLGDVDRFMRLAKSLQARWLLAAALMQLLTYVSVAWAWRLALHATGVHVRFRSLLSLSLQKLFVDQSLPSGGMSGNAYLVTALVRRGADARDCLGALLAGLVAHYGAYLVTAAAGVAALMASGAWRAWLWPVVAAFCAICLVIPGALIGMRRRHGWLPGRLRRMPGLANVLEAYAAAPTTMLRRGWLLLEMTAAETAVGIFDAATLWLMLRGLGAETPALAAFGAYAAATMVAMLGPVPLGLGTFEATCVATLAAAGTSVEAALLGTLLLRGWMTWLPMLPGLWLVRRELHGRKLPSSIDALAELDEHSTGPTGPMGS